MRYEDLETVDQHSPWIPWLKFEHDLKYIVYAFAPTFSQPSALAAPDENL